MPKSWNLFVFFLYVSLLLGFSLKRAQPIWSVRNHSTMSVFIMRIEWNLPIRKSKSNFLWRWINLVDNQIKVEQLMNLIIYDPWNGHKVNKVRSQKPIWMLLAQGKKWQIHFIYYETYGISACTQYATSSLSREKCSWFDCLHLLPKWMMCSVRQMISTMGGRLLL